MALFNKLGSCWLVLQEAARFFPAFEPFRKELPGDLFHLVGERITFKPVSGDQVLRNRVLAGAGLADEDYSEHKNHAPKKT